MKRVKHIKNPQYSIVKQSYEQAKKLWVEARQELNEYESQLVSPSFKSKFLSLSALETSMG